MPFISDRQTLSDLGIINRDDKTPELFHYYDRTVTPGGQRKLFKLLRNPLSDRASLENRKAEISYFLELDKHLQLQRRPFMFVEHYLSNRHLPLRNNIIDAFRDKIANKLKASNDYYIIKEGIFHLTGILKNLKEFLELLKHTKPPATLCEDFDRMRKYLSEAPLERFLPKRPELAENLKSRQINTLDHFFRSDQKEELISVLDLIYKIDVMQSNCRLLKDAAFSLPEYAAEPNPAFEAEDCFHPLIVTPVANSLKLEGSKSLCFITGPNMSGKTTFMKTIGLLTWFSHLGFPVPAKKLTIPVLSGLFTTINLSDSLSQGFSHFYSEVNRVREMALALQKNGKMMVILDELFRGTNVKDAFEATLLVVRALAGIKESYFFVSTHILEVAEQLAGTINIDFKCFESTLNQNVPVYDYLLKQGISTERVGMQIIKNENIEAILDEIIRNQKIEPPENTQTDPGIFP